VTEIQLKIDQLDYPFVVEREPIPYSSRSQYSDERIREICETIQQPFTVYDVAAILSRYLKYSKTRIQIGCYLSSQAWVVKEGRWCKNGKKQTFYRIVESAES
jgi:hypothetical protein